MISKLVSIKERKVAGIEIRTTNQEEMNPGTARIPGPWERFYQERILKRIPNKKPNSFPLGGVYCKYESDHTGPYSLLVGTEMFDPNVIPEEMTTLTILPADTSFLLREGQCLTH